MPSVFGARHTPSSMVELGQQFDLWGNLGSTRTVPVRQGNEAVAPPKKRDPHQLPMFMTGREIQEQASPGDTAIDDEDKMWAYKRGDAVLSPSGVYGQPDLNLASSVRRHGVQRPVDIFHEQTGSKPLTLVQGQHRVAVGAMVAPDRLIPVVHHAPTKEVGRLAPMARVEETIRSARRFGWQDTV